MKVTMVWRHPEYALPEPGKSEEFFENLKEAIEAFENRVSDRRYPGVYKDPPDEGGPQAWVAKGWDTHIEYPDWVLYFGKRGKVVIERR